MEELTPTFRSVSENKPSWGVVLSLVVVVTVFSSGIYVLAFYLR